MTTSLWNLAVTQFWQVGALAAVVAVVAFLFGRRQPHLAHLLWMLVLIKALTPPVWSSGLSPFSRMQSEPPPVVQASPPLSSSSSAIEPTIVHNVAAPVAEQPVSPAAPTVAERGSLKTNWRNFVIAAWLLGIGVATASVWLLYALWWRAVHRSAVTYGESLGSEFRELAQKVGLRTPPQLLVSRLPSGPVAGGILQPTVVLPAAFAELPQAELRSLLAHELVHLRRRDPLTALVQWAAVALWWWNPVVWFASCAVTRERERCCDAEVLGTLGLDPHAYAQSLIDVVRERMAARPRAVPLTMPLTSPVGRRLEYIMRGKRFVARPPKQNLIIAAALALLVLPGAPLLTPVASQETAKQSPARSGSSPADVADSDSQDSQTPELLYLTWQKGDQGTARTEPHTLWRPDGSLVPEAEAMQVLSDVRSFQFHWKAAEELRPLVLVFRCPMEQQAFSVQPIAISVDGVRSSGRTWTPNEGKSLCRSAVAFRKDELEKWPEAIALELVYPIEDEQVIRTFTEIPDEPIEIAEGVSWRLDPRFAVERDPATGRSQSIPGQTTAVLQTVPDLDPLTRYDARVFLKNDDATSQPVSEEGVTNIEIAGETLGIRFTRPFAAEQIDQVEFRRRRYARSTIDNVRLRLELLAQVWGDADPADIAAIERFDDDYALPDNVSVSRIAPPYPASRMAYYRIKHAEQAKHIPDGPGNILFRWNGVSLLPGQMWFDERGAEVRDLLPSIVGIGPDRLHGDEGLLGTHLQGDFVVEVDASYQSRAEDMERLLSEALGEPVELNLQNSAVDVYVASGKFQLSDTARERGFVLIVGALRGSANSVEDAIEHAHQAPRPPLDYFLNRSLSECIGMPVVNEVETPPEERIYYQSVLGQNVLTNFDPAPVIKGVSEQTGLTFTREKRELLTLTVERGN